MNFTGFPPTDKGFEGQFADVLDRVSRQERRRNPWRGEGRAAYGILDAAYAMGGPAMVRIGGLDEPLTGPYNWRSPYVPNGSRVVSLAYNGIDWEIVGQTDSSPFGGFVPFVLDAAWGGYNALAQDSAWRETIGSTRLPTGLIVLSGLIRNKVTTGFNQRIATLPPSHRPEKEVIVNFEYSNTAGCMSITPAGEVFIRGAGSVAGQYVSLDGIMFWSADSEATGNWITIGTGGTSFATGFGADASWSTQFGVPAVYQDRYGFVWGRGLIRVNVAQSVGDTPMVNLPTSMRSYLQQHLRTASNETIGMVGSRPSAGGIDWKPPSNGTVGGWVSLYGFAICTPSANANNPWKITATYQNSWISLNESLYPRAAWLRRGDGLATFRGMVSSGSTSLPITSYTGYPEVYPSPRKLILACMTADRRGRLDFRGELASDVAPRVIQPSDVASNWVSFDSLSYVP